ncbi:MAG: hypothetical protein AB1630_08425 [bacterium]
MGDETIEHKPHVVSSFKSGFEVFYPNDPDRDGRKDHFVSNAVDPTLAIIYDFLNPEESLNDMEYNYLGRTFGNNIKINIDVPYRIEKTKVGEWIKENLHKK